MTRLYRCDSCKGLTEHRHWIFKCTYCGREICESCMFGWSACMDCKDVHDLEEIKKKFEENNEL